MKQVKIVSILLLTAIVVSISSCRSKSSPSDTIKKAYKLMKTQDFEKVTAL